MSNDKKIAMAFSVSEDRLQDLFTAGLEGGINYWACVDDYKCPVKYDFLCEIPFKGGYLSIKDTYGNLDEPFKVDKGALVKGLSIMSAKCPRHFADFVKGNEDALTGDVLVQCAVFGELLYG